jgi:hypothetical protein
VDRNGSLLVRGQRRWPALDRRYAAREILRRLDARTPGTPPGRLTSQRAVACRGRYEDRLITVDAHRDGLVDE